MTLVAMTFVSPESDGRLGKAGTWNFLAVRLCIKSTKLRTLEKNGARYMRQPGCLSKMDEQPSKRRTMPDTSTPDHERQSTAFPPRAS